MRSKARLTPPRRRRSLSLSLSQASDAAVDVDKIREKISETRQTSLDLFQKV